jgi:flagellin-like hook-associated protein FlgL
MMTNSTLMHINRNMRQLDEVMRQMASTKRVERGSDDPIIASRALKFRAGISENEQFQRNVAAGHAWMNVTESTFHNINSHLMFEIQRLTTQGATQTNNLDNQLTVVHQLESLFDIMVAEVNQRHAGQFLFSGMRTNEPPIFDQNAPNRQFIITQHFDLSHVNRERSFQRLPNAEGLEVPVVHEVNVLRLAFDRVDFDGSDVLLQVPGFHVIPMSLQDVDAYLPEAEFGGMPVLHFIRETGELVMHNDTANSFPREGISVTYQRTGFQRGEPNPAVYFTSREITVPNFDRDDGIERLYRITEYFSRAAGTSDGAGNYTFTLQFTPYSNPDAHSALMASLPIGATLTGNTLTIPEHTFNTQTNVRVQYTMEWTTADGDIKTNLSVAGVELVRALEGGIPVPLDAAEPNGSFNMENQSIYVEFAMHTQVAINSLAADLLTDKMIADFRRLFQMADSLRITDRPILMQHFGPEGLGYTGAELDRVVEAHRNWEYTQARSALQTKFNNMLYLVRRHAETATREQTLLGARMVRLDLIQDRLEADYVSYNRLATQNEATDMIAALTMRMNLLAALEGSLRANSGIVNLTLANFIR